MQHSSKPAKSIHAGGGASSLNSSLPSSNALLEEIRPLIQVYGVNAAALDKSFDESLWQVGAGTMTGESEEESRSCLLGVVLYKLFVTNSPLWIRSRTANGNEVSVELLIAAYAIWHEGESFAARCNVDAATAAEALADTTYAVADGVAKNGWKDGRGKEIKHVGNYLFRAYGNRIIRIAGKAGLFRTEHMDATDWLAELQRSDKGLVLNAVESGIFCRELIDSMPPRGRSVAVLRYIHGYTWLETAEALGITISTAQKALSVGFKKVLGICSRELLKEGDVDAKRGTPNRKRRGIGLWR